jgi:hypothetical protein
VGRRLLFGGRLEQPPSLPESLRAELWQQLRGEAAEIEQLLGRPIADWSSAVGIETAQGT